jgi:hypothetical protein
MRLDDGFGFAVATAQHIGAISAQLAGVISAQL